MNDPPRSRAGKEIEEGLSADAVMEELANVETKVLERHETREMDEALSRAGETRLSEGKALA